MLNINDGFRELDEKNDVPTLFKGNPINPNIKSYILMLEIEDNTSIMSLKKHRTIEKYEIVYNVEQNYGRNGEEEGWNFETHDKVKVTTYYPWALAENTPENLQWIEAVKAQEIIRDNAQKKFASLLRKVKTFQIRK